MISFRSLALALSCTAPAFSQTLLQSELQIISPPLGQASGWFGREFSADDGRVLIGAPASNQPGSASVYARTASGWQFQAALQTAQFDGRTLGRAVGLSGSSALLGGIYGGVDGAFSGRVAVFEESAGLWQEQAPLDASDGGALDEFGAALAMSGELAAIGAPGWDWGVLANSGAVYLFERVGGVWVEQALLVPDEPQQDLAFGSGVEFANGRLLIHAAGWSPSDYPFIDSGALYEFESTPGGWVQVQHLTTPNPTQDGYGFGRTFDVEVDRLAVGFESSNAAKVMVYRRSAGSWVLEQAIQLSGFTCSCNTFGRSIALEGDALFVGEPARNVNIGFAGVSGVVHEFRRGPSGLFEQLGFHTIVPNAGWEGLGASIAATDGLLLAASPAANVFGPTAGAVAVFDAVLGEVTCAGQPNSVSAGARLFVGGSSFATDGRVRLFADRLPVGEPALFLAAPTGAFVPGAGGSQGDLCVGGAIQRLGTSVAGAGGALWSVDAGPPAVAAGETWYFQAWYRDGATSNFSAARSVTFR